MLFRTLIVSVLIISLLSGCSLFAAPADTGRTQKTTQAPQDTHRTSQINQTATLITEEEAKSIALEHAGFTADQVTGLYASFDYDNGRPEYDVHFRQGYLEYEYEIDAETGNILSWDKDD